MRRQPYLNAAILVLACSLVACDRGPASPSEAAARIAPLIDEDLPAADEILREALVRWPEDPALRELQGDIDLERGFGTRAQAAFERAIRAAPGNRSLQAKLARALLVQERYEEVRSVATPLPGDTDDVQGRLRLIRLEAELKLEKRDFASARDEAEALWRLAARGTGTEILRRRLDEAAPEFEAIEAGRQHAQCQVSTQPARSAAPGVATGRVLRVGPGEQLATPAAAASAAVDGDVIEIGSGTYEDEAVTWKQDGLTIRGSGGRPLVRIAGGAGGYAWTIAGRNTVIENVEIDGGGIRLDGAGLTVRDSVVRADRALAAGDGASGEVLVSGTELEARSAAVAVGAVGKLTVEFSYIHGGGKVTSRARETSIGYNRITATSGPLLELPAGGGVEIVGNELATDGATGSPFISFGDVAATLAEGSALGVVNNSLSAAAGGSVGVRARGGAPVVVANNVFEGPDIEAFEGTAVDGGNVTSRRALVAAGDGDFSLVAGSAAIDTAIDPEALRKSAPRAAFEYLHPASGTQRVVVWKPDAGAHELCAAPAGSE